MMQSLQLGSFYRNDLARLFNFCLIDNLTKAVF